MSVAFGSFHFSSPWFRSDLTESDCWIWLQSSFFFWSLPASGNVDQLLLLGFTGFYWIFTGFYWISGDGWGDIRRPDINQWNVQGNRWQFSLVFFPPPPPSQRLFTKFSLRTTSRSFLSVFFWKGGRAIPILFCLSVCVCVCVCTICGELKKITKTHRSETNPPLNGSDRKVHHLRWHQLPEWIDRFTTFRSRKKKRKEK